MKVKNTYTCNTVIGTVIRAWGLESFRLVTVFILLLTEQEIYPEPQFCVCFCFSINFGGVFVCFLICKLMGLKTIFISQTDCEDQEKQWMWKNLMWKNYRVPTLNSYHCILFLKWYLNLGSMNIPPPPPNYMQTRMCLYLYHLILGSAVSDGTPSNCGLTKCKSTFLSNYTNSRDKPSRTGMAVPQSSAAQAPSLLLFCFTEPLVFSS